PFAGALRIASRQLPATLPRAFGTGVPVRLGRRDLLYDETDAVLRPRARGTGRLWSRLHRAWTGHHAHRRAHPGASGTRPTRRTARSGFGEAKAVSLSTGADPILGSWNGHSRAQAGRRRKTAQSLASRTGPSGDRILQLGRKDGEDGEEGKDGESASSSPIGDLRLLRLLRPRERL